MPHYTVKQVSELSGVTVRTLHFYDETGLLKPARTGLNGYRYYDEPQLLLLQQILFYRELGFELKQIKQVLSSPDFDKLPALESHRQTLQKNLSRTHELLQTIDKTIAHLKGTRPMKSEEIFTGFSIPPGRDRFDSPADLGGEPSDCKLSARDTSGTLAIFEFTGHGGGPRHAHHEQDEWAYVVHGEALFHVGNELRRLAAGESIFIPRKTPHGWSTPAGRPATVINVYQPAGNIEDFFRAVAAASAANELPTREDCLANTYKEDQIKFLHTLFAAHGMDLLGPTPIVG